jgi:phytoene desaturase
LKSVAIIGSGFSSLSAASYLAAAGYSVHIFEKNDSLGGRARKFEDQGFHFDMGPSWYWMPEVFESFFADFDHTTSDFYELIRLDPSYQVIFEDQTLPVPATKERFLDMAEELERGSHEKISNYLNEAEYKYNTAMKGFVQKPSLSFTEYLHPGYLFKALKLNMFNSVSAHVEKVTKNKKLREILEFPVLFLGKTPKRIPAMYSMMNHADIALGTWYPMGGMHKIIEGFESVARELGVKIHLNSPVERIDINALNQAGIVVNGNSRGFDVVVSGADYHHTEQFLLPAQHRTYSPNYWKSKTFAPSCLIYYIGINRTLPKLEHHNLFFDANFSQHGKEIYETHKWPEDPLFYVCCPSKTDPSVVPEGCENLFILIPVSTEIEDSQEIRDEYFEKTKLRIKNQTGVDISDHILVQRSYARSNFISDYNAYKGNAYGLANTLNQTAFLKPKMRHKKIQNLYFTGQLTVPGPGVPPSIISGQIVANLVSKNHPI